KLLKPVTARPSTSAMTSPIRSPASRPAPSSTSSTTTPLAISYCLRCTAESSLNTRPRRCPASLRRTGSDTLVAGSSRSSPTFTRTSVTPSLRRNSLNRARVPGAVKPTSGGSSDDRPIARPSYSSTMSPAFKSQRAARPIEPVRGGQTVGDLLQTDAEPAAMHRAAAFQLLDNAHGDIDRNRERHAHEGAGAAVDLRIDADDFALQVEQRSAGVAGVDGHVGLQKRYIVLARQAAPFGRNN